MGSRERITTLIESEIPCLWERFESGAKWICITRRSESGFLWSIVKADSAEGVWFSLAPNGFAVPLVCPGYFAGEPRVGVRAEPGSLVNWVNWSMNWGAMPLGRRRTGAVRTIPRFGSSSSELGFVGLNGLVGIRDDDRTGAILWAGRAFFMS